MHDKSLLRSIRVWLAETASVPHIRDLLSREGPGKGRVFLLPQVGDSRHVEIALPGGFQVTPRLAEALKSTPGVERVEDMWLPTKPPSTPPCCRTSRP